MAFYSSAEAVRARTGVRPDDLGQADDEALKAFLEELLTEVADLINRQIGQSYLDAEPVPPGLAGIAADVASDSVRTMQATRQSPVVRIDDFAVTTLRARFFSDDVLRRLRLYGDAGSVSVPITSPWAGPSTADPLGYIESNE